MKKTVCSLLMAGGLFGTQAHAAVTIPNRVAEAKDLGGLEAITKLPYAQLEVASWLNWSNWQNF